jgi:hypothetical protein
VLEISDKSCCGYNPPSSEGPMMLFDLEDGPNELLGAQAASASPPRIPNSSSRSSVFNVKRDSFHLVD